MTQTKRKKRSDAKITIKPTVDILVKETVYRLAHVTRTPVKDIGEKLCLNGLESRKILDKLSNSFKRDIRINNTLYRGFINNPGVVRRRSADTCDRFTLRVTQQAYEVIAALAYALDCSIARVCSLIIEESLNDFDFINEFVRTYLSENLDKKRLKELENILNIVNEETEEESSFFSLLGHMVDTVREPFMTMKETVDTFVIHHWKD